MRSGTPPSYRFARTEQDPMRIAFVQIRIREVSRYLRSVAPAFCDRWRRIIWIHIKHFDLLAQWGWDHAKTAFAHAEIWDAPRWLRSAPPALRDRLRTVTWTGNLLVFGFVV